MPTTRTEVMQAIELAALVLSAVDTAANYRESFVELMGLDPGLVERGRGRQAARILSTVLCRAAPGRRRFEDRSSRGPRNGVAAAS